MKTRRIIVDAVASVSALSVVVSNLMSAAQDTGQTRGLTREEWVEFLSVAVFAGTLIFTIDAVLAELERLREAHAEAFQGMRMAETAHLLSQTSRWTDDHPAAVHVRSARDVAQHLVNFVPGLVRDIEQFYGHSAATGSMVVPDQSPVHDLLANLAQHLPQGGVWLGVTLLEQEKTWADPDEAFSRFATTVRRRARHEILAGRLYHFTHDDAASAMAATMAREGQAGISIRYRSGGVRRDMSLLYAPPEDERNRITGPLESDCVRQLREQKYELICAVSFQTRADGVLRGASIYGPKHQEAGVLEGLFELAWRDAHPCPPPVEIAGGTVLQSATPAAAVS